jgi:hypothetical protein
MKKYSILTIILCMLFFNLLAFDLPVQEKETIKKTLSFSDSSGSKEVMVDNLFGSIDVEGYNGKDVKLVIHKTIHAITQKRVEKAKREVQLEISEENNIIELFVDAPYRCQKHSIRCKGWRSYGYKVTYDFKLKVPYDTSLLLQTVSDGEIKVEKVIGNYDIKNINGGIKIIEAEGSGRAYAVNGDVKVIFNKNPDSACYFGTINGDVEITFQPLLSANFRIKSIYGEAYSDFPVEYINKSMPIEVRKKGKYVYKSDRSVYFRVGDGGPEIELDTLTGDILIKERINKEGGMK